MRLGHRGRKRLACSLSGHGDQARVEVGAMFLRCAKGVAICVLVAVAIPASVGDSPRSWICAETTSQEEVCRDCPGLQVCYCLYVGAQCVSSDIICNHRPVMTTGLFIYAANPTFCYMSRACHSRFGGTCHPTNNPCDKDDTRGLVGTMDYPVWVGSCL